LTVYQLIYQSFSAAEIYIKAINSDSVEQYSPLVLNALLKLFFFVFINILLNRILSSSLKLYSKLLYAIHAIVNQRKKPDDKNIDIINSKEKKGEDFVIGPP
jgi:hypothetical protein